MRLHNFCIDSYGICSFKSNTTLFENETETEAFRARRNSASSLQSATSDNQGLRRYLEGSSLGTFLTDSLGERDITRPATC